MAEMRSGITCANSEDVTPLPRLFRHMDAGAAEG